MRSIKFIYFDGCPNAQKIMNILSELNIDFEKIEQTSLTDGNQFKNYSSPTVIVDEEIIFGSQADGGGCSLNLPTTEFFKSKLLG
ncbi:glutathione S-transferase N-terminal domain-containing protein [Halobacteriovorax sp. RZ-1]|uniref:glutathione S-transferase N-terminal domain-containing protein n=1 Tax=unclassified Halobacteriovorax TaxID=2639665 RepID=UPI003724934D